MGKWTLAHTEALCSEKFHTALQKPLDQSGLKLEEFLEAFDPRDPVVQKLFGALVNDIAQRKVTSRTSCPSGRVTERCADAISFINSHGPDSYPVYSSFSSSRPRSSTIRARRRQEIYNTMNVPDMPWRTSYSSWSPDADDLVPDHPSSASMNIYQAFNEEPTQTGDIQRESESSGEYWWRAAMRGHAVGSPESSSASPTPFIPDRSPSPPMLPRSPRPPLPRGVPSWSVRSSRRRPIIVVEPDSSSNDQRPLRLRSPSAPPIAQEGDASPSNPSRSTALGGLEPSPSGGTPRPASPEYYAAPIPGVPTITAFRSPAVGQYQPTNVEVFTYDRDNLVPRWHRSPSPVPGSLPTTPPGLTTVTVEDSLWR